MVYVISQNGIPLMPTKRYGKVLTVSGVQNKGQYIKLAELPKPIRTDLVKPYMYRRGIYAC